MYAGRDFDTSDTGEVEWYGFDYGAILAAGETIVSVVWTCAVETGTDASPMTHLSGSPVIEASQQTLAAASATIQLVSGLIPGNLYRLQAMATTSLGQMLSLWSHVLSITPM